MKVFSMSQLLSSSSLTGLPDQSNNYSRNQPPFQTFIFAPHPASPETTVVSLAQPNGQRIPLITTTTSSKSSRAVTISRLVINGPHQHQQQQPMQVGTAKFHCLSSTIDISLPHQHPHPIEMKQNSLSGSGNYSFIYPRAGGKLKWKVSQTSLSGSSLSLVDSNTNQKLAQIKSNRGDSSGGDGGKSTFMGKINKMSEKRLEIYVPCDDFFVDLVVLSGLAVKEMKAKETEAAMEVMNAVGGAGA